MSAPTTKFHLKFFMVIVAGLMAIGLDIGAAQADATWKNLRGHSACGGIDQAGQLQQPCGFQQATFARKATTTCPQGSFAGAGSCYICPQGFSRNLIRKVTHEKACRKKVPDRTAGAVFIGPAKCPSGSKYDPRNGGECWACPAGFKRTLAAVDKWNACGKIGKKAQAAAFAGRACPDKDAVRDPRNGGECWKCPEDYGRTANPVTGNRACKISFTFAQALQKSELKCAPGEIFDLLSGNCYTCPQGYKRTAFGVKSAKACRNNQMQWVTPKRQLYGLFGLGAGADDILAKMIAERTEIDDAIALMAQTADTDQKTLQASSWEVIDTRPWESPILSSLLARRVMIAAAKSASQRTPSEKDLLSRMAQLIQWNRQFVAYQAKQAHETWVRSSKAVFDVTLSKMGAAAVYADSVVTPPNYNEVLVATIQGATMIAGPVGAALLPLLNPKTTAVLFPYRVIGTKVIENAAGEVIERIPVFAKASVKGMSMQAIVASGAVGPLMIAIAASVIVSMEIDKFLALEKADGQIRQALALADRPVDVRVLLQKKGGPEEFMFHWSTLFGAPTKPSANFTARLAAYKAGKAPGAITSGPTSAPVGSTSQPGMTTGTGAVALSGGLPGANTPATAQPAPQQQAEPQQRAAASPSLGRLIERAVSKQHRSVPRDAMKIELSNMDGKCMTKQRGTDQEMTMTGCGDRRALWIVPDAARKALVFADKYCLHATSPMLSGKVPGYIVVNECMNSRAQQWLLTQEGLIQKANTDKCMTAHRNGKITLQGCGTDPKRQIWRQFQN